MQHAAGFRSDRVRRIDTCPVSPSRVPLLAGNPAGALYPLTSFLGAVLNEIRDAMAKCPFSAGVIALTFEPTPVPKIATFLLTVAGGITILNQFIRIFREKKLREKKLREHRQNGHE